MKHSLRYFLFAFFLIVVDQVIKLWVEFVAFPQHFGSIKLIPEVFSINYELNSGAAFGMKLGFKYGKLILSVFRLIASGFIAYILYSYAQKSQGKNTILWGGAAILAGAIGNCIDGTLYGVLIPDNKIPDAPFSLFHGQVIDMFTFDILKDIAVPFGVPFIGGIQPFNYVFNFADASIFCGVVYLMFNQKKLLELERIVSNKNEENKDSGGESIDSDPLDSENKINDEYAQK
ncbi:MAG: signal peptidase II [Leadbetterella sp.]